MNTSHRRACGGIRMVRGGQCCWLVVVWCAGQTLLPTPAAAQAPPASRQELMRKWDIDRDGKVDASEAEIARGRMRRSRADTIMNSGTDPVTGQPRVATDPATGRPMSPEAAATGRGGVSGPVDDDGLILVPGNGEKPRASSDTAAGDDMMPRPSQRDREALPGTRAPVTSSTIPSVSPRLSTGLSGGAPVPDTRSRLPGAGSAAGRPASGLPASGRSAAGRPAAGFQGPSPRDAGGADLSGRARLLPGQNPAVRGPQAVGSGQDRQQPGSRPGVIAGGVRAGAPGARPGYGGGGVPPDLNAGRPTGQPPLMPRPGIGPYRGPTPPGGQAAGVPSVPRTPNTAPRGPRMTTDEFYGR